ncbi:hypothetical protein [Paramagnetospirillum magneticum]|uniref:Uncharacterized protein n=1 Tax=Paramagnetospirillum magneticum (strain ATCC 700264 / AMB-1) TaxID=342108 RepID=Q2VZY1_PARM1|nr:hypothetical protein [Paramagnetospirillum magneticum]BAE52844.1 hypothetical protein amb4040 [Paramagnetospirillum magneticum AMB-1]
MLLQKMKKPAHWRAAIVALGRSVEVGCWKFGPPLRIAFAGEKIVRPEVQTVAIVVLDALPPPGPYDQSGDCLQGATDARNGSSNVVIALAIGVERPSKTKAAVFETVKVLPKELGGFRVVGEGDKNELLPIGWTEFGEV